MRWSTDRPWPSRATVEREFAASQQRSKERRRPSPHPWPHRRDLLAVVLAAGLIMVGLIAAREAAAAPFLTRTLAGRAVSTYETRYWHQPVKLLGCRRHGAIHVSCTARVAQPQRTIDVTDRVTLLAHGILRVHPGQFAEEIRLEG